MSANCILLHFSLNQSATIEKVSCIKIAKLINENIHLVFGSSVSIFETIIDGGFLSLSTVGEGDLLSLRICKSSLITLNIEYLSNEMDNYFEVRRC